MVLLLLEMMLRLLMRKMQVRAAALLHRAA
jgi:hypothetical protein